MNATDKPRLLIMTDIGGDPDDEQSLVRLLVHASEFDIEGIVPDLWEHHEGRNGVLDESTQLDVVRQAFERYHQVYPSLVRHDSGFPEASALDAVLKRGHVRIPQPVAGQPKEVLGTVIGEGHDTEGSQWVIQAVDREDPRPLDICLWGGCATLAQALWRVRQTRDDAGVARFVSRIRVHSIQDQDDTGPWIREAFPELFYILDHSRDGDKLNSCFRGMFLGGDESLTSLDWLNAHVRTGHGPLGKWYPAKTWTASNPHSALKEGDTPSWFYFYRNGLQVPAEPSYGGWGGRFERVNTWWQDAMDTIDGQTSHRATVWRWRPAFQREFAARMDWCVTEPGGANHPPIAVVNAEQGVAPVEITAAPGVQVILDASGSHDPDGDELSYRWWVYREAGTYGGAVPVESPADRRTAVRVPVDSAGTRIHVILEVTDSGEPPLTSYRRVLLSVR
ncbi:MAG: DUF1593 domain-containing protein [Chitinivibrionales bacterium]|nr:DUF1593 domain-containing protein [Chitinivibrionales bacterium]